MKALSFRWLLIGHSFVLSSQEFLCPLPDVHILCPANDRNSCTQIHFHDHNITSNRSNGRRDRSPRPGSVQCHVLRQTLHRAPEHPHLRPSDVWIILCTLCPVLCPGVHVESETNPETKELRGHDRWQSGCLQQQYQPERITRQWATGWKFQSY